MRDHGFDVARLLIRIVAPAGPLAHVLQRDGRRENGDAVGTPLLAMDGEVIYSGPSVDPRRQGKVLVARLQLLQADDIRASLPGGKRGDAPGAGGWNWTFQVTMRMGDGPA